MHESAVGLAETN